MRVTLTKEEVMGDVLPGGQHGPGLENDSEVEIFKFDFPAGKFPAYDKDGSRGPYGHFTLKITPTSTGKAVFCDKWVETDRLSRFIRAAGGGVEDTPDEGVAFDTDEVVGVKLRGVVLKEPREWEGKSYTGDVKEFIAD